MAPRWPHVEDEPDDIKRHATYLKEACNQIRAVARGKITQVPWKVVQGFVTSTIALAGKVLQQPALSDTLQYIQDIVRCTQNIQKDVRDIKNFKESYPTQTYVPNANETRGRPTYAQAAVRAQATQVPPPPTPYNGIPGNPQSTDIAAYRDRLVTVKLNDHGIAQSYRTQTASWIKRQVENAIHNTEAIKSVRIVAPHQLKSGDVQIVAASTAEALQLQRTSNG